MATFGEALESSDGYEHPEVIAVVAEKTAALSDAHPSSRKVKSRQALQRLLAVARTGHRDVRVLELGGACGAGYIETDRSLPGVLASWAVVETPAMVDVARERFSDGQLSFHTSIDEALGTVGRPDLVIAEGVIQYTPDPIATVRSLTRIAAPVLYVSRSPVVRSGVAPVFGRQTTRARAHGPGSGPGATISDTTVTLPVAIVSYEDVLAATEPDYRLEMEFDEGEAWRVSGSRLEDVGLLLRRA